MDMGTLFRRERSPLVTSPSEIGRLVSRWRETPPIRLETTTNVKARSVQEVGRVAELSGEGVDGSFTLVGHHVFGREAEAKALAQPKVARNGLLAQVGEQPRAIVWPGEAEVRRAPGDSSSPRRALASQVISTRKGPLVARPAHAAARSPRGGAELPRVAERAKFFSRTRGVHAGRAVDARVLANE